MKNLLFIFTMLLVIRVSAQNAPVRYNYVSNSTETIRQDVVSGEPGTNAKTIVTYTGNWPLEAKGAFEYACKILEGSLLGTYPVNIHAVWNTTESGLSNAPVLSSIRPSYTFSSYYDRNELTTVIKGSMYNYHYDYHKVSHHTEVNLDSLLTETDIELTYYNFNNKITDNCDFSIDSDITSTKYDFTTLVLRDLLKAMGLDSKITINDSGQISNDYLYENDFERKIMEALNGHTDASDLTNGSFTVDNLQLYAPSNWDNYQSLNYLIPSANNQLSQLMRPNFGRNCVVRNIPYDEYFWYQYLGWNYDVTTGALRSPLRNSCVNELEWGDAVNSNSLIGDTLILPEHLSNNERFIQDENSYDEYFQYFPWFGRGQSLYTALAVQLKNGKYDIIQDEIHSNPTNLNGDAFTGYQLNFPAEEYARTCTGKLRGVAFSIDDNTRRINNIVFTYYPQKIEATSSAVVRLQGNSFYAVTGKRKIAMKNLEGTTSLVARRIANGRITDQEITDFKKGSFEINVSERDTTHIVLLAYNDMGCTESDTLTIIGQKTSVAPPGGGFIGLGDNTIMLMSSDSEEQDNDINIENYSIKAIIPNANNEIGDVTSDTQINGNIIDISNLSSGIYNVNILTDRSEILNKQFYHKK